MEAQVYRSVRFCAIYIGWLEEVVYTINSLRISMLAWTVLYSICYTGNACHLESKRVLRKISPFIQFRVDHEVGRPGLMFEIYVPGEHAV